MTGLFRIDFNDLPGDALTLDQVEPSQTLTNSGSNASATTDGVPGFATFRAIGTVAGPVLFGPDTEDFIGINSYSGAGAPNFGPGGEPVTVGSEQNFRFNDTDGGVILTLDPISALGYTNLFLNFSFWISGESGFEGEDRLGSGCIDAPVKM